MKILKKNNFGLGETRSHVFKTCSILLRLLFEWCFGTRVCPVCLIHFKSFPHFCHRWQMFVAQGVGKKSLLALFGLNAGGMPKVDLTHPMLPVFYCATSTKGPNIGEFSMIEDNFIKALEALQTRFTRNSVICFDDSVYWPTYAITYWPQPVIVGGVGDKAWIEIPEDADLDQTIDALERESLAQTCISWMLSRADSNAQVFDVCMRPRRLKQATAASIMLEAGQIWADATAANGGVPPLAQSCDNHQSQVCMNQLFSGLLPDEMSKLPFPGFKIGIPSVYAYLRICFDRCCFYGLLP